MNSIEPTSNPRVGCATSSNRSSPDSSRAMMIFCWLPPDSVPVTTWGDEVRMSKRSMSSLALRSIAARSMSSHFEKLRRWYRFSTRLSVTG